jgi:hypothetical protein
VIDWIANPVDKLPERNMSDPNEHQLWYRFSDPAKSWSLFTFEIENQFGVQTWELDYTPRRFLVTPARKVPHGPPLQDHHYLCYDAHGVSGLIPKTLEDQWGQETVLIQEPRIFCNPVEKSVGGFVVSPILDGDDHLACYNIEGAVPDDHVESWVYVDQFGNWGTTAREHLLLCVPSTKVIQMTVKPPLIRTMGPMGFAVLAAAMVTLTIVWFAKRPTTNA